MAQNTYKDHDASQFDAEGGVLACFARSESMDLVNDPRFMTGNVLNKRLAAFNKLTVVSSLMLGTAMGQMFKLKKDMDFTELAWGWLPMGVIQFIGFLINMVVAFMCLTSCYIMVHQIFYIFRLLTAGPMGFEQASLFYLNRRIVMWRHFAIKCLLNGLWLFIVATGVLVFVKFYKDAKGKNKPPEHVVILNMLGPQPEHPDPKLDMMIHTAIGGVALVCFTCCACLLYHIKGVHNRCFQKHYSLLHGISMPLMEQARGMSGRAGLSIDE